MTLTLLLQNHPALLIAVLFVLGLLIGSFINVVVYRLPRMMEAGWRIEARNLLDLPAEPPAERFNLMVPRSHCPHCNHQIRWFENIPVVSWLALRAKCSQCGKRISARYPVVELAAGLLGALAAWHAGYGAWLVLLVFALWMLLTLALIDFDTTLLPDVLNYPLLWAALLASWAGISPVPLHDALFGAAVGYLALWSLYWVFKLLTGKEGMGYGDFKLLAALGAWLGWQLLPLVILLSSLVGAVAGGLLLATGAVQRGQGIPFGPYLAGAGLIALLWGNQIVDAYLGLMKF
ncbi:prepilin peptidase [Alcanivorax quisquiliarum]|uniref:Prepilin leader peptidase/N-methyltransferase n=1 Tax=Alcanivorax quisquiliarum TaxID=2933565 RepID=A0ABT0EAG7_9GAMM|nr:A24 family peptidase [Alcanivorax quisquiliarum]MCK0538831.1 A24 family peptidase [Alcanivorax quisquiliarum]